MAWKFEGLGYESDVEEMHISNDTFLYAFYAEPSSEPYFSIRPSLNLRSNTLIAEINAITTHQILTNCTFPFGERLNQHLGKSKIRGYRSEENIYHYIAHQYDIRIYKEEDYDWGLSWFQHYITEVCFPLVEQLKDPIDLYHFLKNIFERQIHAQKVNDLRELLHSYKLSIGPDAIITMIYLGYKYDLEGIHELAELAANDKEGPRYQEPVIDLIRHFEN